MSETIRREFTGDIDGLCVSVGIIPASTLGILFPLCMYGTVSIVASFSKSGMHED